LKNIYSRTITPAPVFLGRLFNLGLHVIFYKAHDFEKRGCNIMLYNITQQLLIIFRKGSSFTSTHPVIDIRTQTTPVLPRHSDRTQFDE
jgi:hypothetical protein